MLTLPTATTDDLRDFCNEIAPGVDPVYLTPRPFRRATEDGSFQNVRSFIWPRWLTGAKAQPGWLIWQWPGAFLVAHQHCVALMDDGTLRDVTPSHHSDRVLFLPDNSVTAPDKDNPYGGKTVSRALTPDPLVASFLLANHARDQFYRDHIRPGLNVLSPELYKEMSEVENKAVRLRRAVARRMHPESGFVSKKRAA